MVQRITPAPQVSKLPHPPKKEFGAFKEIFNDPVYRILSYLCVAGFIFCGGLYAGRKAASEPMSENLRGQISTPRRFDTVSSFREFLSVEKGIDASNFQITRVLMPETELVVVRNHLALLSQRSPEYRNIFSAVTTLTSDVPTSVYVSDPVSIRTICDWGHAAGCHFGGTNVFVYASDGTDFSTPIRRHERVHEFSHYLTERVTNGIFEYKTPGNVTISLQTPTRFREGTNELFTLTSIGSLDANDSVRYPIETRIALILRLICTPSDLFAATFTGDWHLVQEKVDRALGSNTFGRLVSFMQGADVGAQAGEYQDPSACVPLEYLLRLIRLRPPLLAQFTSMTQTDFIWKQSRETCDSSGNVVLTTDPLPSPPAAASRQRRPSPRPRLVRSSTPDASVEIAPAPPVVLPPPRPRTLAQRRFEAHLATLTNPSERDRFTRAYDTAVSNAALLNSHYPGSAIVVVDTNGIVSVRPTGF